MEASVLSAPELLMSMTDIAALASVERPVVSNWRRRHTDFPPPAGGDDSKPLFSPRAVANWLLSTRRVPRDRAEQELSLFMLGRLAARYPGPDVFGAVTALVCLRQLAGEFNPVGDGAGDPVAAARALAKEYDPNDGVVLSEVRSIPRDAGWLVRLADDLVEASWSCRDAFECVMKARHRFGPGSLVAGTVAPELAQLIADLSGAADRARRGSPVVVADPAAGPGDLLAAVARMLAPDGTPEFFAAEADPVLARLTRRRLLVHGIQPEDITVTAGAGLPEDARDPDVIVTQIPYQPGEARDAVAVLEQVGDVAIRLSRDRFGVVLGPASVLAGELVPFSQGERARADLLKGFMVEAVIRLPVGLVPFRPGYETALWVVTQARDSRWRGRVLIADVSDRKLTREVVRDLVEDVVTWRRDGYVPGAHRRVFGQQVAIRDLIDPPRPLIVGGRPESPRERSADAAARVARITQHAADLDRIGATATADRRHVSAETLAAADVAPARESIGALVRARRLTLHPGTRVKAGHIRASGHHVVLGTAEVLGEQSRGQRRVDREDFARNYPSARLTEPGDVLVTTGARSGAIVDFLGYSIAESPVRVLRIPAGEAEQFTPRVLAALFFADGPADRVAGVPHPGRDLDDHRILLLSPVQVRALDRLLGQADARRDLASKELSVLDELQHDVIGGLFDGTLTLTNDKEHGQDD